MINKLTRKRQKLINIGYNKLKAEGRLDFLEYLESVLTNTKLDQVKLDQVCHSYNPDVELSVRQYISMRVLSYKFNKSLLYSIGSNSPLRHPLPKEWRRELINQGVEVDCLSSAFLFFVYSLVYWMSGVLQGIKAIPVFFNKAPLLGRYIYFDHLIKNRNNNCFSENLDDYNIINWYLKWRNKSEKIKNIRHSVSSQSHFKLDNISITNNGFYPSLSKIKMFQYLYFLVSLSLYYLATLIVRPYQGWLFAEIIKVKIFELADKGKLAEDYLFNNSNNVYRPMWTFLVENKGSRVIFYFYSINDEAFKRNGRYPSHNQLHLMSWPYYLVWDRHHADFIKRLNQRNSIIEEVGVTWFSSGKMGVEICSNSIAVFDVTPSDWSLYITYGAPLEYYIYSISNKFVVDIYTTLKSNNIFTVFKTKRIDKAKSCNKYVANLKQLNRNSDFTMLDPGIAPLQVIKKTKACISAPFTTTALIAKSEGKPSVYYDPSGIIDKNDRAAHDIPVLSNIDELQEWVESIN